MPVSFSGPVAVLCEGSADVAFLGALGDRRSLGAFDLPFPPREPQMPGDPPLHGATGFGNMLRRIENEASLDLTLWQRLRGIVIAADTGENAVGTLDLIAKQCRSAGYGTPSTLGIWTVSPKPRPPVAVVLLPSADRPGGLETLCLDYLRSRYAAEWKCVEAFFGCVPQPAQARTVEKQDKAALACLVAAIEPDPTMTLARAFTRSSPMVDLTHDVFSPLADELTRLLTTVP